jgi:hypothetical protein
MGQLTPQTPRSHTCPAAQALPHAPQFARSLWASTQVAAPPSSPPPQRRRFAGHSTPQRPAVQVCPAAQALPHMPQCARSLCTSAQLLPQSVCDEGQLWAQAPFAQTLPAGHAVPQAPQCWALLWGFTHCPLQARSPAAQTTSAGAVAASVAPTMVLGLLHEDSAARASVGIKRDQDVSFMRASVAGEGPSRRGAEDLPRTSARATLGRRP